MNNLWRTENKSQSSFIFKENTTMNKKSINKAKQIRRTRKKGCLSFLRSAGVKRRHAYYYSYQKNMDQQKYYKMTMSKTLPHDVVETMRERVLSGEPIMLNNVKRRYEKPKIVIHESEIVPSLRCRLFL